MVFLTHSPEYCDSECVFSFVIVCQFVPREDMRKNQMVNSSNLGNVAGMELGYQVLASYIIYFIILEFHNVFKSHAFVIFGFLYLLYNQKSTSFKNRNRKKMF